MRNLLQFIVRHANFLLFALLEILALALVVTCHDYQRSAFISSANSSIATINAGADNIHAYFLLNETNNRLAEDNALLRSQLSALSHLKEDSICASAQCPFAGAYRYLPAKVVDITTNRQTNYITLNRGSEDGVYTGLGVVSDDGVVGIVSAVSKHFALVVPLIHTKSNLSCRIQRNGYIGFTQWNGTNYRNVSLMDIARHVDVMEGDTIVTSGLTGVFEEGVPVGVVLESTLSDGDSYRNVKVRLSTDYRRLQYVYVLFNPMRTELDSLYQKL